MLCCMRCGDMLLSGDGGDGGGGDNDVVGGSDDASKALFAW